MTIDIDRDKDEAARTAKPQPDKTKKTEPRRDDEGNTAHPEDDAAASQRPPSDS